MWQRQIWNNRGDQLFVAWNLSVKLVEIFQMAAALSTPYFSFRFNVENQIGSSIFLSKGNERTLFDLVNGWNTKRLILPPHKSDAARKPS